MMKPAAARNREIGGKRAETEPVGSVFDRCAGEADQHYRRVAESGDRDQYNADLAILYERNEVEQQKGAEMEHRRTH